MRWESGSTALVTLCDGSWSLFGDHYQLRDTTPVSLEWADGTVQTVESWDGRTVTWTTTRADFARIFWDVVPHEAEGEDGDGGDESD